MFFFVPDHITIGLDAETRALIERVLDDDNGPLQAKIDALTKRLADSKAKLAGVIAANPDPNPND